MALPCGGIPPTQVTLAGSDGSSVALFVTGTDPDIGGTVNQIIDMTTEAGDFTPSGLAAGGTFSILIESVGTIVVELQDDSLFTISAAHTTTYLGDWIRMRIKKVFKTGTTGTFSVGF